MKPRDALKKIHAPRNITSHSEKVKKKAEAIARRIAAKGVKVDLQVVRAGALLHDVGRTKTHGITHGVEGGRILRALGFGERVARIAETHVVCGLTKAEAVKLGLPAKSYLPRSVEEKIVCYADKLSDEGKVKRILSHFKKNGSVAKRMKKLFKEFEGVDD